jgi:hypothetical protein
VPLRRCRPLAELPETHPMFAIEPIDLDAGGCHQCWRIDDFQPVVSEADNLFLAKLLQRPADVNVGKAESLADMNLAQR